jgi:lipopolysaccharide transport system ATP-binding protein
MSDIVVHAVGLGKEFMIGSKQEKYKTFRDTLAGAASFPARAVRKLARGGGEKSVARDVAFQALEDVSFDVRRGEAVGIIGHNGAGKSTLLKILSRITDPTRGYVDIRGRVASLLEVGTGFHPELSGRENIYLNGAILGMRRVEIERKFDEIVSFAEVEKFIDTPVKHYSSGMYLRLAFAVAAHLEQEVLLIDEVLAVGDASFQKKCLGKMEDVARQGRTVLFVSHNMGAMSALCESVVLLEKGRVKKSGPAGEVIGAYLASLDESAGSVALRERTDRGGSGSAKLTGLRLVDSEGAPLRSIISGRECSFELTYESMSMLRRPVFKATVYNSVGQPLFQFDSSLVDAPFYRMPQLGTVCCRLQRLPLSRGKYRMNVSLEDEGVALDHVISAFTFAVEEGDYYGNGRNVAGLSEVCLIDQNWAAVGKEETADLALTNY